MEFSKYILPVEKRQQVLSSDRLLTYPYGLHTSHLVVDMDTPNQEHANGDSFQNEFKGLVRESVERGMKIILSFEHSSPVRSYCEKISEEIPNIALVRHGHLKKEELGPYFDWMFERFGFNGGHSTLIASSRDLNISTALERGMGLITGSALIDAMCKTPHLIAKSEITPFDPAQLIFRTYQPRYSQILAVIGHTGSGKTTLGNRIWNSVRDEIPTDILHFDSYHAFSRRVRLAMLGQAKHLPSEVRREVEDHENWYLFDDVEEDLARLKSFQEIRRTGMYNQKTGELSGKVNIKPDVRGQLTIFEGVATHKFPEFTDELLVLTTHPITRLRNLKNRDRYPTDEARMERLRVTQRSEIDYIRNASKIADHILFMTQDYRFYEVPVAGIL